MERCWKSFPDFVTRAWRPAVDVYRGPRGWLVKLDAAGVVAADVSVEISGRTLHIRGVRRDPRLRELGWRHHVLEIAYCTFERAIEIPEALHDVDISAHTEDGMLFVRLSRPVVEGEPS